MYALYKDVTYVKSISNFPEVNKRKQVNKNKLWVASTQYNLSLKNLFEKKPNDISYIM